MQKHNKVMLIPDAYFGNQSGAIVAQMAKKLLLEIGCKVCVFSVDIENDTIEEDGTELFSRLGYKGLANWNEKPYILEYIKVLDKSNAKVVFTLGSITNKNLCYLEIARRRGLKVISKIFMQDFFCTKLYANNAIGPCLKCLNNNYLEAFKNKCIIQKPIDYIKTANAIFIRKRLEKLLPLVDYVLTSSDEQIGFYLKFGIPKEKCVKIPLFFDSSRLQGFKSTIGNYFICIAQNRIEKGFHYLSKILSFCPPTLNVIMVYNNRDQALQAIKNNNFQEYIDKGILQIIFDKDWDNGLAELVANSRGVIIPSIWPSTTEFGFLEALGFKKPVFTFSVGIHDELIINYYNGFKVPIGDFHLMAQQIMDINNDDELYDKISKNAILLYNDLTSLNNWILILKSLGL